MTKCRCVFYGLNLKHEVMDVISPCLYIYHILCANYPFMVINACMNRKGMLVFEWYSTMEHKVKINASKNLSKTQVHTASKYLIFKTKI